MRSFPTGTDRAMIARVKRSRRWAGCFAALVAGAALAGCGGGGASPSADPRQNAIKNADAQVLARLDKHIRDWNEAAAEWSATYKSGDRDAIMSAMEGTTERLHRAAVSIRLLSPEIHDPELRRGVRQLGIAYRRQETVIVRANNSVVRNDPKAEQRARPRYGAP